ncbi:MAG: hypothetical protein QOE03_2726, partial [Micromonosporaceae bacterium]|nr:hypothetical protein [Micromonosporaceae bacterium]
MSLNTDRQPPDHTTPDHTTPDHTTPDHTPADQPPPDQPAPDRSPPDRSVSVVIATYTERRWTELTETVRSSLTQQPPPARVVVAVDHNEALLARVRAELPQVHAVRNRYARGASGTRNSGVDVV